MDIVNQVISLLKEKLKNKSRYKISQETGIDTHTLNNWIYGNSKPSLESAEILLNSFGLTLSIVEVHNDT